MKANGFCNKCGYVGECEVESGMLKHFRKNGTECPYSAAEAKPTPPTDPIALPSEARLNEIADSIGAFDLHWAAPIERDELRRLINAARLVGPLMAEVEAWRTDPEVAGYESTAVRKAVVATDAALMLAGVKMGEKR